jgi:hypothetical protein
MTLQGHACPDTMSVLWPYTAGQEHLRSSTNSIDCVQGELGKELSNY